MHWFTVLRPPSPPRPPHREGTTTSISTDSTNLTSFSSINSRAPTRGTSLTTEPSSLNLSPPSSSRRSINKPLSPPVKRTDVLTVPLAFRKQDPAASLPTPQSNEPRVRASRPVDNLLPTPPEPPRHVASVVHQERPASPPQAGPSHLPAHKKSR